MGNSLKTEAMVSSPPRERSPRQKYDEAQAQRLRRERDDRLALSEGQESVLETLVPPLMLDNLTNTQVCDYLGISKSSLLAHVRVHGEELRKAGYRPGKQHQLSRFSRRAVIHLAMMIRVGASERADRIKRAFGIYQPPRNMRQRWASHVASCSAIVEKAQAVAEDVQEQDPAEVWEALSRLHRWQVQAMVVALGAMVPLDQHGLLQYLSELGAAGPSQDPRNKKESDAARGLAALIPQTKLESEEDEAFRWA